MRKLILVATIFSSLLGANIVVEDIRIIGLQRVSLGSVLDTIPVTIGDRITSKDYQRIIRTLFATGQFDDIELSSQENVLFVQVEERPTISTISIDGNSAIETNDLLGALASEGVSELCFKESNPRYDYQRIAGSIFSTGEIWSFSGC